MKTGIMQIDQGEGFRKGTLNLLVGLNSTGRSLVLNNWGNHAHQREGESVLHIGMGAFAAWKIYIRHASILFGEKVEDDFFNLVSRERASFVEQLGRLKGGPRYVHDTPFAANTTTEIGNMLRAGGDEGRPFDALIVDELGGITPFKESRCGEKLNQNGRLSSLVYELIDLAKRYDVAVLASTRLNSLPSTDNPADFQNRIPSSDLIHYPYWIAALRADKQRNLATFIGIKTRDRQFDPITVEVNPDTWTLGTKAKILTH